MKIFIVGINGKMGGAICACAEREGIEVAGGLDITPGGKYPVFAKAADVDVAFDVIIDFSRPASLDGVIALAEARKVPAVLATTGYTEEQLAKIAALAEKVPVFRSANMSLGVNVVESVLPALASALGGFDVEIVEAHHNRKVDAPSGTAFHTAQGIAEALEVHDFALAKEFDRFAYIGIVHQAQNIVVGGSGFLLGGEVFHEVGDDIARALQGCCREGNACSALRIDTGRMVDEIGFKAGCLDLLGREVARELIEDGCNHFDMRQLV